MDERICRNANDNNPATSQDNQTSQDCDNASVISKEYVTNTVDFTSVEQEQATPIPSTLRPCKDETPNCKSPKAMPLLIFSRPTSLIMHSPTSHPINLLSQSHISIPNQPQTLFLLALAKLNESSISLTMTNNLHNMSSLLNNQKGYLPELSPPDSLTSAPPSYSFVLRQMTARRRPRLMGTFIPSPSFVQHSPPPNYAAAFDIYVDNAIPPPTTRVYNFGFTPMPVICTECGYTGMTMVRAKVTLCTHLCAFTLCIFCCWLCAPLPYVLRSCKDVYHYCRNCRNYLGRYCPTNPENN
ncbi:uncharacterized protein LOC119838461 [Zerene cesonia]|uniref:uncharacterized protein LOC119838461 n=1 Tax=Zerene cesonia TaxID=33412 RepID=UPI0018E5129E|nr:uncharacterized protein LOC119838461 [Zerene cesonia]